jgi:Protein of unknown function, DUF488
VNTFFTIGHSTRTIVEFADLLQESGVNLVVDVRSIPRSRTNPQFNQKGLPEALAPWQIGYEHIAELGPGEPARRRALTKCLLEGTQLSQLCGLCPDGALCRRHGAAPGAGQRAPMRDHVRGSGLVALPSADHCRLPSRRRRAGDAHPRDVARR